MRSKIAVIRDAPERRIYDRVYDLPRVAFHFKFNIAITKVGTNGIMTNLITLVPFYTFVYINT